VRAATDARHLSLSEREPAAAEHGFRGKTSAPVRPPWAEKGRAKYRYRRGAAVYPYPPGNGLESGWSFQL
jgi:hypothetical protein